jgi:hypothetical protein
VHSKARNRLLPSRAEDLVYVYTNSRVLNQNVPFTDEATTEWYRQTVVSEDVATQDRVLPHYVPNSSIKHSKSDSKDRSQEIL